MLFRDKERELSEKEYLSLLKAAKQKGNQRLFYIMETLCNTGIRISELQFITAEAVRMGTAVVKCKGKQRKVLLPQRLRKELQRYCKRNKIASGAVFITKTGKPISRTNVWGEMKRLCKAAVCRGKEGLSAQLSPSVRGEFLPSGEGYSKAGGSFGTRQHRNYPYLCDGIGGKPYPPD